VVEMDSAKVKKGGSVKINGKLGKIMAIDGPLVTIKPAKVLEVKAGDKVTVDKVTESQGC